MKKRDYYYKLAKEHVETYINIEYNIIDREFEDLDHFTEYLLETINTEYTDVFNDEQCEKENDEQRIGVFDYIFKECNIIFF